MFLLHSGQQRGLKPRKLLRLLMGLQISCSLHRSSVCQFHCGYCEIQSAHSCTTCANNGEFKQSSCYCPLCEKPGFCYTACKLPIFLEFTVDIKQWQPPPPPLLSDVSHICTVWLNICYSNVIPAWLQLNIYTSNIRLWEDITGFEKRTD